MSETNLSDFVTMPRELADRILKLLEIGWKRENAECGHPCIRLDDEIADGYQTEIAELRRLLGK
jgi:hypothetical protein